MEVVVLPPQDVLKRHRHKPRRNPTPVNSNSITNHGSVRSNRRKVQTQSRPVSPPSSGQIRILKRGENLPPPEKNVRVPVQVLGSKVNGFYAGSACVTSPPPSELPLPAFFTRGCALSLVGNDVMVDNNLKIASDLRRVLKLC